MKRDFPMLQLCLFHHNQVSCEKTVHHYKDGKPDDVVQFLTSLLVHDSLGAIPALSKIPKTVENVVAEVSAWSVAQFKR